MSDFPKTMVGSMVLFLITGFVAYKLFPDAIVTFPTSAFYGTFLLLAGISAISFKESAKFGSGAIVAENIRISTYGDAPKYFKDGDMDWMCVSAGGWRHRKAHMNTRNIGLGKGGVMVFVPSRLVERETPNFYVCRVQLYKLALADIPLVMAKRKFREAMESFKGFNSKSIDIYMGWVSASVHPDAKHYGETEQPIISALAQAMTEDEQEFVKVRNNLQDSLAKQLHLFHSVTENPKEGKGIGRDEDAE